MTDAWVVLLGGNPLNAGFPDLAKRLGAKLLVVDWSAAPAITGDKTLQIDIKDSATVTAALDQLGLKVLFAYTAADVATETVAQINERAGLRRPSAEALDRARNKRLMSEAWARAGLLRKNQTVCQRPGDITAFLESEQGDIIVKPVSSSSSRGVSVVRRQDRSRLDLGAIWLRASECDPNEAVLAETFVEGIEYTVEMIGDDEGNVEVWGVSRKHHTSLTVLHRIAVKLHYNPPDMSRSELEELATFGADCFRALGLKSSLGHFEVIRSAEGTLVPVELAARSSGYIATHLLDALAADLPSPWSKGFLPRFVESLSGGVVEEGLLPSERSSMYFFYDPPTGVWSKEGASLADQLAPDIEVLAHDRSRLKAGAYMSAVDCDNDRIGFEILAAPRTCLTESAVAVAETALYAEALTRPDAQLSSE